MANLDPDNVDIFDFQKVLNKSSKAEIVPMSEEASPVTPPGSNKEYLLPKNAKLYDSGGESVSHSLVCEAGTKMAKKFSADESVSLTYAGISASESSQYAYESVFQITTLYGVYSFDQQVYSVQLRQPYDYVNKELIEEALSLPVWSEDKATYEEFKNFFTKWGTHILLECYLGTRYQLTVQQESEDEEWKETFKACVQSEFEGIVVAKAETVNSSDYSRYSKKREIQAKVRGGDSTTGAILSEDPSNKDKFADWQKSRTTGAMDGTLGARVDSIGKFLGASKVQEHIDASKRLVPGLDYFSSFRRFTGYLQGGWWDGKITWAEWKIEPHPALQIIPEQVDGWVTTKIAPNHVRVERERSNNLVVNVPVTVIVPLIPLDITITWSNPSGGTWGALGLSIYPADNIFGWRSRTSIAPKEPGTVHAPTLDTWGSFD
ncbi:hypothetical protein PRK78_004938 [Emydomyces testavorans]|uniref:MACPF domain-containing protein n=1 Tax=Emydomyces testavorans TaxID=2070801 RepID=A0AAF0DJJ6_9EURO|nr:hypothetical protein PRK78_004938 [Emydomyces testavorans]